MSDGLPMYVDVTRKTSPTQRRKDTGASGVLTSPGATGSGEKETLRLKSLLTVIS